MQNTLTQNNSIHISGKIVSSFEISHNVYGEKFFKFYLETERLSDISDILPITISERLLVNNSFELGDCVEINGQIRSYNNYTPEKTHLILTVFVKDISKVEADFKNVNSVFLNGYTCKSAVYRTTPFGREIADILLAVNRPYNKSDYIPSICWGRNAKFAHSLPVGTNIKINGRMQSRNYQKKVDDGTVIEKTAYEVSISKIEIVDDEN